jgi:hypothetical protein
MEIKMKNLFTKVLAASVLTLPCLAIAQEEPRPVEVPLERAYIPRGFDANDQAQMVVEGWFRDSCYRFGTAQIKVDYTNKTIKVRPIALLYGGICLDVMVPFQKTIDLGMLPPGRYSVSQTNGGSLGEVTVSPSMTNEPDDYLYASVSQAYLDVKNGGERIVLAGEYSNTCMRMVDIKVTVEPSVIVVQPITKLIAGDNCRRGRFPFEEVVNIRVLRAGRYLLHVRSMNGNAINSLVDIQ